MRSVFDSIGQSSEHKNISCKVPFLRRMKKIGPKLSILISVESSCIGNCLYVIVTS